MMGRSRRERREERRTSRKISLREEPRSGMREYLPGGTSVKQVSID